MENKETLPIKSMVGKEGKPAGQSHYWIIKAVRKTPLMTFVEFENNFVCNLEIVKLKEDE